MTPTSDLSVEKEKKTTDLLQDRRASHRSSKYGVGEVVGFVVQQTGVLQEPRVSTKSTQAHMIITLTRHPALKHSTGSEIMGSREVIKKTQTSRKLQVKKKNMLL